MLHRMFTSVSFFLALVACGHAGIVYVKPGGTGDGSSWVSPLGRIQAGVNAADAGGQVWVAAGTFYENITLGKGVTLYGGFAGTESDPSQRVLATNVTRITPVADGRVVTIPADSTNAMLDGFSIVRGADQGGVVHAGGCVAVYGSGAVISHNIISKGYVDAAANLPEGPRGAGIYIAATGTLVERNTVTDNTVLGANKTGAGIYVTGGPAVIRWNTITSNHTFLGETGLGGGIAAENAAVTISNNVITGNVVSSYGDGFCNATACFGTGSESDGGGISLNSASGRVANNLITGNTCDAQSFLTTSVVTASAGGVYVKDSPTLAIVNNTVADNAVNALATGPAQLAVSGTTPAIANTILADPTSTPDPKFANRAQGDYHLLAASPYVNTGDDSYLQTGDQDLDGRPRKLGSHVDCGSYEFYTLPSVKYVVAKATGNGSSWASPLGSIQAAVNASPANGEVWVAGGTYTENVTLINGVSLYGGFAGTENWRWDRVPGTNTSRVVLKVDGRVITIPAGSANVTVDGLSLARVESPSGITPNGGCVAIFGPNASLTNNTISNGYTTAAVALPNGTGVYVAATGAVVSGNQITGNFASAGDGGGVFVDGGSAVISGNVLSSNLATEGYKGYGGGLAARNANITIANNVITLNQAFGAGDGYCTDGSCNATAGEAHGGGVSLVGCTGRVADNLITGNSSAGTALSPGATALGRSGGLYVKDGPGLVLVNNTIADNTATGTTADSPEYEVAGTGVPTAANNIVSHLGDAVDPAFLDRANGDYQLDSASPYIDAGDDSAVLPGETDVEGSPRKRGLHVDAGAYEYITGSGPVQAILAGPMSDSRLGAKLNGPLAVYLADAQGRRVTNYDVQFTAAVQPGTGAAGVVLSGTTIRTTVFGRATFADLLVDRPGKGYVLTLSSPLYPRLSTNAFNVIGPATQMVFATQPGGAAQGRVWTDQPVVNAVDAAGNVVPDYQVGGSPASVTLTFKSGTGASGAQIYGNTSATFSAGSAVFAGLFTDKSGTGFVVTATSAPLPPINSTPFDVVPAQMVYRVKPTGNDANDGSSWGKAMQTISAALAEAPLMGEVWVAKGTYLGQIQPARGDALYGGFAGTESTRDQRNWVLNPTILDNRSASGPVIVTNLDYYNYAVDGFTILTTSATDRSPAVYSASLCNVGHNIVTGGCINVADGEVANNLVTSGRGVGILMSRSTSRILNNTIANCNGTGGVGSGIEVASATIANNIIVGNATGFTWTSTDSTTGRVVNNDLYNNTTYTNIPGWTPPSGNINTDPLVTSTTDFHLQAGSPCRQTGALAFIPASVLDLDGHTRGAGGKIDIGCYEASAAYDLGDAASALRAAGGLTTLSASSKARLNRDTNQIVDLRDAVLIARKVAGLN